MSKIRTFLFIFIYLFFCVLYPRPLCYRTHTRTHAHTHASTHTRTHARPHVATLLPSTRSIKFATSTCAQAHKRKQAPTSKKSPPVVLSHLCGVCFPPAKTIKECRIQVSPVSACPNAPGPQAGGPHAQVQGTQAEGPHAPGLQAAEDPHAAREACDDMPIRGRGPHLGESVERSSQ